MALLSYNASLLRCKLVVGQPYFTRRRVSTRASPRYGGIGSCPAVSRCGGRPTGCSGNGFMRRQLGQPLQEFRPRRHQEINGCPRSVQARRTSNSPPRAWLRKPRHAYRWNMHDLHQSGTAKEYESPAVPASDSMELARIYTGPFVAPHCPK